MDNMGRNDTTAETFFGPNEAELVISGISKRYPGVTALDGVTMEVSKGAIHALAGQNGAGKSTLVKILSGAEHPDEGELYVGGRRVRFSEPYDAQEAGIQTIHQELSLVPQLTVAENICLGALPTRNFRVVDRARMNKEANAALQKVGFDLDVGKPVGHYSVAEQQGVELAKALRRDARILLLDEPTSALPQPDVDKLFAVLRNLAAQGVTLLYISHRMDEVFDICSSVTVLRNGQKAATLSTQDSRPEDVIRALVGRDLTGSLIDQAATGEGDARLGSGASDRVLMRVRNLGDGRKVSNVDFDIHEGEVLGICGLVGSGQSQLADLLAGAYPKSVGSMEVAGKAVHFSSPRQAIKEGIGLLPQDRKAHGFVPEMSVTGNVTLADLPAFSRFAVLRGAEERRTADRLANRLDMRIAGVNQKMRTLSGGTQQKAILARWLVRSARLLVCDEPTRGVDVEAKEEIYELLRDFAANGGSVVIATSEISEAKMCDRVLVMARGSVVAVLEHTEIDAQGEALLAKFR